MAKKKIAILGGGVGSLTAAYELTRTPALREQNDVTVYQMGWRLGGKGATGRDAAAGQRIQEHGLHVWFGFYENSFGLLRDVYAERPRDADDPLRTWRDAFAPQSFTPIGEGDGTQPNYFGVTWPTNADEPGDGRLFLTPWGAITEVLSLLKLILEGFLADLSEVSSAPAPAPVATRPVLSWVDALYHEAVWARRQVETAVGGAACGAATAATAGDSPEVLLHRAVQWAKAFEGNHARFAAPHHEGISWLLGEFKAAFEARATQAIAAKPSLRPVWNVIDIGVATIRGLLDPKYGILESQDLNRIDSYELRAWLIENGASPDVVNSSNEVRSYYGTAFAYVDGQLDSPNFAAGTAVRAMLRIVGTYKGAVSFLMRAGMGEIVIAPMYQLLLQNGVKFELFHKVRSLELSEDKSLVSQVVLGRQARVKSGAYRPLEKINHVWCWPSEPFWDQLVDGDAMKAQHVDFESNWCQWPDAETVTLQLGRDFDTVVLGIALGAFKPLNSQPTMCDALAKASPRFNAMVANLGIVPTQSVQFWLTRTTAELGWTGPKPVMTAAPEPFDVWADMSQTLPREVWADQEPPKAVYYFTGVLGTDLFAQPTTAADVPAKAAALVRRNTLLWFKRNTGTLWPAVTTPPARRALDWSVLHAPPEVQGEARVDVQFLRANVDPTECTVGSFVNTTQYRLNANESGFLNLVLAGDWTRTGMNTTCVEGAVMSGMAASRAICGSPATIVGERFLQK